MLKRKMLRDIKQNLSQFITIFLMVFIGVMAYSGIESYMEGMKQTANNFYTDYNLQDINANRRTHKGKFRHNKTNRECKKCRK